MGWLRLDLVKLLLLALPAFALNWFLAGAARSFAESPARAAAVLLPLVLFALVLSLALRRDSSVTLGPGFLAFFPIYCLAFSLATSTDPLIGERRVGLGDAKSLSAFLDGSPSALDGEEQLGEGAGLLRLNRLGDWHYRFASPAPPADDYLVITLAPPRSELRAEGRRRFAFLIRQAVLNNARGLAFDFYLERESPSDAFLGSLLAEASAANVPVFFGNRPILENGVLTAPPAPASLAESLPPARLGHLAGFRESDGRLRMVPLLLQGEKDLEALSYRIAEQLHGGPLAPLPPNALLQFTAPRWGIPTLSFAPTLDWTRMRDRFVLVGTEAAHDLKQTPFGEVRGVVLHAFAAHSLRSGHFIQRLSSLYVFPLLFAACYLITVRYAQGVAARHLVLLALLLSLAIVVLAAVAMWIGLLWVTVSYPLVAIWLLTALLLGGRAYRARRAAPARRETRPGTPLVADPARPTRAEPATAAAGDGFDVFLSHNSRDKPTVKELGLALQERGLEPWLDVWELAPGRDWQAALEEVIRTVRASGVIVGAEGLGPWEIPELRACLSESVRRGLPVIPILLPGAPRQPVLPLFLTQFTWVDLRGGITPAGLDRLEWGVTGIKPAGLASGRAAA